MAQIDSNDAYALFMALRYHPDTVALVRLTVEEVTLVTDKDPEEVAWGLVESDMTARGWDSIRELTGD